VATRKGQVRANGDNWICDLYVRLDVVKAIFLLRGATEFANIVTHIFVPVHTTVWRWHLAPG